MLRAAEVTSLLSPLQELQDRISLEIPPSFTHEESLSEATDQSNAHYSIIYYLTENNDPDGERMDVKGAVRRLAEDVLTEYEEVEWDIHHDKRSRDTHRLTVTVHWAEEPTTAAAEAEDGYDVFPLTTYAGQDVYNIATDGNSFVVLSNGHPVVEAPSAQYALGALVSLLRGRLTEMEAEAGFAASPPTDFLAATALSIIDDPGLSDEAKEYFVQFYELATLKDFAALEEGNE